VGFLFGILRAAEKGVEAVAAFQAAVFENGHLPLLFLVLVV